MDVQTLQLFLKGRQRKRSTQVYTCDALWIIASSLGNKIARYSEIMSKSEEPKQEQHTTEEVVNNLVSVLKADAERRTKGGS